MSYHPPSSVCRQLYEFDNRMRFGLAVRAPELGGPAVFVALYLPRYEVGNYVDRSKMYFMAQEAIGYVGIYDKDGRLGGANVRDGVPVLFWWPRMEEVMSGSAVSLLRYHSKPEQELLRDMKQRAREEGRELKRATRDSGYEMMQYGKWARRIDTNATRILVDKEDVKAGLKRPENAKLKTYLDGGGSDYEQRAIEGYGLENVPD